MDQFLLPYLEATDESKRQECLDELLLLHAAPVIRNTLRLKLGFYVDHSGASTYNPDAEDLYQEVMAKIIQTLNDLRGNEQSGGDLRGDDLRGDDLRGGDLKADDPKGDNPIGDDPNGDDLRGDGLRGHGPKADYTKGDSLRGAFKKAEIVRFPEYVFRVASNACVNYLRAKSPARKRLKDNVRVILIRHPDFAIWKTEGGEAKAEAFKSEKAKAEKAKAQTVKSEKAKAGRAIAEWLKSEKPKAEKVKADTVKSEKANAGRAEGGYLCGFAAWQRSRKSVSPKREAMLDDSKLELFRSIRLSHTDLTQIPLSKVIAELFEWADEPIELNKLVNSLAYLLDLKDQRDQPLETEAQLLPNAHERPVEQITGRVEERELLRRLWEALKQLPKEQRDAYTFRFHDDDGNDLFSLLIEAGIVNLRQLAETFGRSAQEIRRLRSQMPMDGGTAAAELGVSTSQVHKLRFLAAKRLKDELLPILGGKNKL